MEPESLFSSDQIQTDDILRYFEFKHLPLHLQEHSIPFGEMAKRLLETTPRCPERTVALRKLLEAKDAAVRAALWKPIQA